MDIEKLPDLTDLARLAYETSLRTLTQQEASLNELRARTGTLVAAASLVTSFLGGAAFTRSGFDAWSVLALMAFVVVIGSATWVLLPRENHLVFSIHGSKLYEGEIRDDVFAIGETYGASPTGSTASTTTTIPRSTDSSTSTAARPLFCLSRSPLGAASSR